MIGINIIKINKPDIKSHQRGCYFKRKKNVFRKVLISSIVFFILLCVLNVNLQHVFAVSLPLVFLFICVYWRHTHDFHTKWCSCLVEQGVLLYFQSIFFRPLHCFVLFLSAIAHACPSLYDICLLPLESSILSYLWGKRK